MQRMADLMKHAGKPCSKLRIKNIQIFLKQECVEKIYLYGIAFYRKFCKVVCEQENINLF